MKDIDYAYLENNGTISIIKKGEIETNRPNKK
jgi:uncharacterized membrane protein YcaP (DUF421 family)